MKIVVVGGSGLIGSRTLPVLRDAGHEAEPASPLNGVNTLTGEGLDAALAGAQVVIDVVNSPSFEPAAVMDFFTAHETNLLAAEARAGVRHHVALSIVGTDRLPENAYFQAKVAQEALIARSGMPYTIVRATQFMEFIATIANAGEQDGAIHVGTGLFQPIAADDVARFLAEAALSAPRQGIVEVAGPMRAPLDVIVRDYLVQRGDSRHVTADPEARYFGAKVDRLSLVPMGDAALGRVTLTEWMLRNPA